MDLHALSAQSRRRPRRHRGLRWTVAVTVACLAALAGWTGYRVAAGKTTPPRFTRESAESARRALRAAHGDRWAPAASRSAERAFMDAALEWRRQETSFLVFRNYDDARRLFAQADDKLRQATRVAEEMRSDERGRAERAIAKARQIVGGTDAIADAIGLGRYEGMLLQKCKIGVDEADRLFKIEEYEKAAQRAELAALQSGRVIDRAAELVARFSDPQLVRKWRGMIDDTVAWSRRTGGTAFVVSKEAHEMTVYVRGRAVETLKVELGSNSVRDKLHAGDNATPEGRYKVVSKIAASRYERALLLDYPNAEDRQRFAAARLHGELPRGVSPGGLIEVHGGGGRGKDWTNGCVAVTDREMDRVFARASVGTPVTIVGSDGAAGTFTNVVRMQKMAAGATGGARAAE